jgi:hypothetical protein
VHGDPDVLEIVDPLLALWVLQGRQGLAEPITESEQF